MVFRELHFSFDYNTRENLDYVYQRIILLLEDGNKYGAQSFAEEFDEPIDERWCV